MYNTNLVEIVVMSNLVKSLILLFWGPVILTLCGCISSRNIYEPTASYVVLENGQYKLYFSKEVIVRCAKDISLDNDEQKGLDYISNLQSSITINPEKPNNINEVDIYICLSKFMYNLLKQEKFLVYDNSIGNFIPYKIKKFESDENGSGICVDSKHGNQIYLLTLSLP